MTAQTGLLLPCRVGVAAGRYARLTKPRIAALSTLSAAAGFLLAAPDPLARMLPALAGVFLLACGCGALNMCQERELDARMRRTRDRPLPAGELRPREAFLFSACLMLPGLLLLRRSGAAAALLGLVAALWYNGVYTNLKKRSAYALLPGALVGAVPPAIGWVSAGGGIGDPRLAALCLFLFLWQVPHSALHVLAHGEEYTGAGLPVLTDVVPPRRLARLVVLGVLGTAAAGLLLPLPGQPAPFRFLLAGAALALAASCRRIPAVEAPVLRLAFHAHNGYLLLVLALAVVAGSRA